MKVLILTINDKEENVIDKIITAISDVAELEAAQVTPVSVLSFPGLEIRQNQRRVFQDGEEINLTRLEYSTLVFLASNPGIVLTQTQIFEAVWNMDSDSCHSSVVNVIYKSLCLLFHYSKLFINFPKNYTIFSFPCVVRNKGDVT